MHTARRVLQAWCHRGSKKFSCAAESSNDTGLNSTYSIHITGKVVLFVMER
jgi:hypothetical protein